MRFALLSAINVFLSFGTNTSSFKADPIVENITINVPLNRVGEIMQCSDTSKLIQWHAGCRKIYIINSSPPDAYLLWIYEQPLPFMDPLALYGHAVLSNSTNSFKIIVTPAVPTPEVISKVHDEGASVVEDFRIEWTVIKSSDNVTLVRHSNRLELGWLQNSFAATPIKRERIRSTLNALKACAEKKGQACGE